MASRASGTLFNSAVAAAKSGNLPEAERLCRLVLASEPQQIGAIELLAEIMVRTGRPDQATVGFRNVIAAQRNMLTANTIAHGLHVLRNVGFRPHGILDVGAYHGEWAVMAHHFFPDANILMIEAQPALEPHLAAAASKGGGRIELHIALLGAESRDAIDFFRIDVADTSGSSIYTEQTSFPRSMLRLPMHRLDDIVARRQPMRHELLKLDVQGAELDVLRGARATLENVEVVVMELSLLEYNKGAPLVAEIVKVMNDEFGFRLFDIYPLNRNREGVLIQADSVFVRDGSPLRPTPPFF